MRGAETDTEAEAEGRPGPRPGPGPGPRPGPGPGPGPRPGPAFARNAGDGGDRAEGRTARRGEGTGTGDSPRTAATRSGGLRGCVCRFRVLDVGVGVASREGRARSARSSRLCAAETGGEDDAGAPGDDLLDAEPGDANESTASRSAYAVNIAGGDCAYGSGTSSSSDGSKSGEGSAISGASAVSAVSGGSVSRGSARSCSASAASHSRTRLSSPRGDGLGRLPGRVDDRLPGRLPGGVLANSSAAMAAALTPLRPIHPCTTFLSSSNFAICASRDATVSARFAVSVCNRSTSCESPSDSRRSVSNSRLVASFRSRSPPSASRMNAASSASLLARAATARNARSRHASNARALPDLIPRRARLATTATRFSCALRSTTSSAQW